MSEAERSVIRLLDRDAIVETACDLIAIPSLPAQERQAQVYVSQFLGRAGATVDVWTIDRATLARHPAFSAEVERSKPLGVVGEIGAGDGAALLIDGHVDVVPAGDGGDWNSPPFEASIREGLLYGRGACDTKGGLAAALHAMHAISTSGVELAGRIRLASVVGEEDGGSGTLAALLHGVTGDGCIVLEPTELCIAPAVAGALSFRVRVKGRSAHGALRSEGVSAIERLPVMLEGLQELERLRNARLRDPLFEWARTPFAICVGRVAGGDWPSSVADWVTLEGRYGVAPGEDLDDARAELELVVAQAALRDPWLTEVPPTVEWWGGRFLPGRTEPSDRVVATLLGAHETVTGQRPLVRGMPYGCDLGLTNSVGGIPSVVYGPGDVRDAHRPDEHVAVDDLVTAARVLAITALRYCGVASQ